MGGGASRINLDDAEDFLIDFGEYVLNNIHDIDVKTSVKREDNILIMEISFQESKYTSKSSQLFVEKKKEVEKLLVDFDVNNERNLYKKFISYDVATWDPFG